MKLNITFKNQNHFKTQSIPIDKQGVLWSIDNFLKYGILNNTEKNKTKLIKNLEIIYDSGENQSQITERINTIILKVIRFVKNI